MITKDDLILEYQIEQYEYDREQAEVDYQIEESIEADIESQKIEKYEKLTLLKNLLNEVTSQIEEAKPNIPKLKEMMINWVG